MERREFMKGAIVAGGVAFSPAEILGQNTPSLQGGSQFLGEILEQYQGLRSTAHFDGRGRLYLPDSPIQLSISKSPYTFSQSGEVGYEVRASRGLRPQEENIARRYQVGTGDLRRDLWMLFSVKNDDITIFETSEAIASTDESPGGYKVHENISMKTKQEGLEVRLGSSSPANISVTIPGAVFPREYEQLANLMYRDSRIGGR